MALFLQLDKEEAMDNLLVRETDPKKCQHDRGGDCIHPKSPKNARCQEENVGYCIYNPANAKHTERR